MSVQVQNDDGQSDIAPFSYNAEEPPLTLSNLIPPQGPNDESNTVLLVGQSFEVGATVRLENTELGYSVEVQDGIWLSVTLMRKTFPAF